MELTSLSLKTRITLYSLGISLVMLWSLSYLASQVLHKDAERVLGEQQFATVSMVASQIGRELEGRLNAIKKVAPKAASSLKNGPTAMQAFLDEHQVTQMLFDGSLFITGTDGIVVACTPNSPVRTGTDLNDQDYIQSSLVRGEASVGKPVNAGPSNTPIIAMAAPILDSHGKVAGVLSGVVALDRSNFLAQIPESHYGKTGGYLLISRAHRLIITATEKTRVLTALPERGSIPVLDQFLEGFDGSATYVNSRGDEVLSSAKSIPTADWILLATLPTSEAFAPLYDMQDFMLRTTIVLTLLAGALTWWMAKRQLLPLQVAVKSLAEQSNNKDAFLPLAVTRKDEIGQLIGGFNQLLEILKNRETSLRESEARFRVLHDASFGGLVIHENGIILECNQAFADLTGYSFEELIGLKGSKLLAPESLDTVRQNITRGYEHPYDVVGVRKDGSRYPLSIQGKTIPYGGKAVRVTEFRDITERKRSEAEIYRLAFYDQLTGLPNRQLLCDRIGHALAKRFRHRSQGAVLFIDINHFQRINDSQGREVGDSLLQHMAQRLKLCVRDGDTISRVGSDQFVVLLEGLSDSLDRAEKQAKTVADKTVVALHKVYQLDDSAVQCSVCIGIAMFDSQSETETLLSHAEWAMREAKAKDSLPVRFFDPQMQTVVVAQATLESDLRQALLKAQFLLHYQIQVDSSGRNVGAEALLRWKHPERGFVSPAEFIPMAEDTGLILPIGQWVLETACRQLSVWAKQPSMANLSLAVNVSARQFHHNDFVSQVLDVLAETQANPHRLKLELTEGLLINDVEGVISKMTLLKEKGVSFSLDDFGTGYSSLSYLKRLPLDQLKIDQSFVRDILVDANDASIARTVVALSQNLGLDVIAEGVETELHRDFLKSNGCLMYQGYYFSRPLPLEEFERFCQQDLSDGSQQ